MICWIRIIEKFFFINKKIKKYFYLELLFFNFSWFNFYDRNSMYD